MMIVGKTAFFRNPGFPPRRRWGFSAPQAVLAFHRKDGLLKDGTNPCVVFRRERQFAKTANVGNLPLNCFLRRRRKDQQVGPFDLAKPSCFQSLEVEFERPDIARGRGPAWSVWDSEKLFCCIHSLDQPLFTPHTLRPSHQKVASPESARIKPKIEPRQERRIPKNVLQILLLNQKLPFERVLVASWVTHEAPSEICRVRPNIQSCRSFQDKRVRLDFSSTVPTKMAIYDPFNQTNVITASVNQMRFLSHHLEESPVISTRRADQPFWNS
jgi:hypothetical protein